MVGALKGSLRLMQGKKAEKFLEKNLPKENIGEHVEGMVACKGVIEGKAWIISAQSDIKKKMENMTKGAVLVVNQTRPYLMPAVYKASAIVTDEGGITSHAAIVAREFNIPCIVGTRIATKTFKDGDKILVDAEKGITKKI